MKKPGVLQRRALFFLRKRVVTAYFFAAGFFAAGFLAAAFFGAAFLGAAAFFVFFIILLFLFFPNIFMNSEEFKDLGTLHLERRNIEYYP